AGTLPDVPGDDGRPSTGALEDLPRADAPEDGRASEDAGGQRHPEAPPKTSARSQEAVPQKIPLQKWPARLHRQAPCREIVMNCHLGRAAPAGVKTAAFSNRPKSCIFTPPLTYRRRPGRPV